MTRKLVWIAVVTATTFVLIPATANAAQIFNYRVHDAGAQIVERYRFCLNVTPGYEVRVRDRTRVELWEGGDPHTYDAIKYYGRGCHVVRNNFPDELTYEGTYYSRLRIRIGTTGQVLYSSWRSFYSS